MAYTAPECYRNTSECQQEPERCMGTVPLWARKARGCTAGAGWSLEGQFVLPGVSNA